MVAAHQQCYVQRRFMSGRRLVAATLAQEATQEECYA